jgi:hypothetical protein
MEGARFLLKKCKLQIRIRAITLKITSSRILENFFFPQTLKIPLLMDKNRIIWRGCPRHIRT